MRVGVRVFVDGYVLLFLAFGLWKRFLKIVVTVKRRKKAEEDLAKALRR
jgi:hypothetical protein